nr:unnamed protein product [Digitaria exilis]
MTRGSELATILFVAGVVLLFVLFACGVVSFQLCINAFYRRRAAQAAASSSQSPSPRPRPRRSGRARTQTKRVAGDPAEAPPRSLPATAVYRAADAGSTAAEKCAVCLAGLDDGEEAQLMPCCGHWFHALCVDTWLASHATCPLCRIAVARPGMAPVDLSRVPSVVSDHVVVTVATELY